MAFEFLNKSQREDGAIDRESFFLCGFTIDWLHFKSRKKLSNWNIRIHFLVKWCSISPVGYDQVIRHWVGVGRYIPINLQNLMLDKRCPVKRARTYLPTCFYVFSPFLPEYSNYYKHLNLMNAIFRWRKEKKIFIKVKFIIGFILMRKVGSFCHVDDHNLETKSEVMR